MYRYRYDQHFIIGCRYFLKKRWLYQTAGSNQNFIIRCRYFSCYLFITLQHFSHKSLPYLWDDGLNIFLFFIVCGVVGLLLWPKFKKRKRSVSLPSLTGNYQKSYSCIYVKSCKTGSEVWRYCTGKGCQ